jgi:hypothetical protein
MPRDNATTFGDLIGKLDVLRVGCEKCGRTGRYPLDRLIEQRGADGTILDFLAELSADCPRRIAGKISDRCGALCPDLPRVL